MEPSPTVLGYNPKIIPPMRNRVGARILLFLAAAAAATAQTTAPKPTQISSAQSSPTPSSSASVPQFEDVAQEAGLTVPHISSPDKKYIVESMSGGVGLIDCDNDGKLDIITVNGSTVERYRQGGDPMITLYHQSADSKSTTRSLLTSPKPRDSRTRVGAWVLRLRTTTMTGSRIFT